ncbi:lysostaphin resistance A-like protein [Gottfriedia sp. NPDC056225]|uniref:CPBP family intramembrane glutamic endopeptidase n=1 Tax=Bacillaceae TaxID=186817 RepID=UPI000BEF7EAB|nr:CPBP family intramembrane glutamic endopeptidase [Bacillus sp. AFS002410]PEJ56125.1 CPBP family intramembrane metalloprotease [Bacillus sp. AFS002410]QKE74732.1 CPBP family intramembrane metalloprotease [Arthrobacter citreus]
MKTRDLLIILTYAVIQYSAAFGVPYLLNSNLYAGVEKKTASLEAVALWSCISFITGLIIILILLHKPIFEGMKNFKHNYRTILNWVILGYFITMATQIVCNIILIYVFNLHTGSENTQNILNIAKLNPAFIIIPSLVAPILEEIIFRRIIFKRLYNRLPFIISAGISSAIFSFMHGDLPFFLSYFLIGFVFCYLYKRTNSIIVPILTHMLMNTFVVFQQLNLH